MDFSFLNKNKIIPVVVLSNIAETLPKLSALKRGGINIAEITFRTDCAEDAIKLAIKEFGHEMIIGAGTIISEDQCKKAIAAGAKFIVSPGLSVEVSIVCKNNNVPYIPGVVTPTDIINAKALNFKVLKFFPAEAFGGVKALKAMAAAFPDVMFVPTGGIDQSNLKEYLSQEFVVAVGGSWMMKGEVENIEYLTSAAVSAMEDNE